MTVMVKKIGGSMAVVIPKALARDMNLREGTALELRGSGEEIVMRRQGRRPRRPLADLVKQMNAAAYKRHNKEFLADKPVGREIG